MDAYLQQEVQRVMREIKAFGDQEYLEAKKRMEAMVAEIGDPERKAIVQEFVDQMLPNLRRSLDGIAKAGSEGVYHVANRTSDHY